MTTHTNKLISICIPTHNGEKTIAHTLTALITEVSKVDNHSGEIEIVLTDDLSSDNTRMIIDDFAIKHPYIKVFKNDTNLGMDGNFRQSAINASGDFVWFSGQDDIFLDGSIAHAVKRIKENPDLGIIYINYSQYAEESRNIVCRSMFHKQAYDPSLVNYDNDLFFTDAKEYFDFFNDAPSFLPATIMRREHWLADDLTMFMGTHFIQYANVLIHMAHSRICAITKPYIRGLIPAHGWQKNGNILFSVTLGHMKAQTLVFDHFKGVLPDRLFVKKKLDFILHFMRLALASKYLGFKLSKTNKDDLIYIFGKLLYTCYFLPTLFISSLFPDQFIKTVHKVMETAFHDPHEKDCR